MIHRPVNPYFSLPTTAHINFERRAACNSSRGILYALSVSKFNKRKLILFRNNIPTSRAKGKNREFHCLISGYQKPPQR